MLLILLVPGCIGMSSLNARADIDDGVTIHEVANLEPQKAISYIYKEASRRALELSQLHGDAVSRCLRREVVRIETKADGNHVFPRGLKAAIQDIHVANINGHQTAPAAKRINGMIDLIAERVCGVAHATDE